MTSLAERASDLLQRGGVERLELSRRGEVLAQLSGKGEPHWIALDAQGERELDPAHDSEVPLAGQLDSLRSFQGARLLAWKPGRRMVVLVQRSDSPFGKAVIRGLRSGRFRAALERHVEGALAAREAGLVAAEVLAVDPEHASFTLTWLGERRVPIGMSRADRFFGLGQALARFQRVPGAGQLEMHGIEDELAVLEELRARTIRLRGLLPAGWERARDDVTRRLRGSVAGSAVRAHRDLHDGQLLEVEGGLALLDFDLLCRADEALDPGNLLAHLELRELQGLAAPDSALACSQAVRAGYGGSGERELELRLAAWCAASLLRLALVYHLRPTLAHLGPTLVERALARISEDRHGIR